MSIHGFMDQNGQIQKYDYDDLENKPTIPAEVLIDATLTQEDQAADAKAVGDALNNITIPVDSTLTQQGAAADAKVVGDLLNSLTLGIDSEDGLLYLYIDGNKQGQGIDIDTGKSEVRRNITYILPHAISTNHSSTILETTEYRTIIIAESRYNLTNVVITMGGIVQTNVYDPITGAVNIPLVSGDIVIEAQTALAPIDLLDVDWADHAVTCGQSTNNYNAWSPHNMQYDDVNDKWLILQCHADKHLNHTYLPWTLSAFNPYDPTDVTDIELPSQDWLGMLYVENGVWWVFERSKTHIYKSSDQGSTWETITLESNMPRLFGIYKVGNHYFAGDDVNSGTKYYHSTDLINWETKYFSSELGYATLCETTFCEFNGRFWAFNRTNDAELGHPVILVSDDEGTTWTLWSDQYLHGYRSTVSCLPFQTYIMIADIDRDNGYIYYSKFDGETIEQIKSWRVPSAGDDFHNINIATNYTDTIVMEFMHSVPYYDESNGLYEGNHNKACDNVMLIGSTLPMPSLKKTFYSTSSELLAFLNENCTTGLNESANNEYRWVYGGGTGFKLQKKVNGSWAYMQSDNTFEDEVDVPLGLSHYTGSNGNFYVKWYGSLCKLWTNNYTGPRTAYYLNYSESIAIVKINNQVYEYGMRRAGDLPVLIKVPYKYNISLTPSSSQNAIEDQEWQEELPLRRVFNVSLNKSSCGIGTTSGYSSAQFCLCEYVPASTEEND